MLIEDVRHHYGHHHYYDEGPDPATGALSFLTPVLARQMGDIGSGKSERDQTTTRQKRR
jgi:fatty-acid desaturase